MTRRSKSEEERLERDLALATGDEIGDIEVSPGVTLLNLLSNEIVQKETGRISLPEIGKLIDGARETGEIGRQVQILLHRLKSRQNLPPPVMLNGGVEPSDLILFVVGSVLSQKHGPPRYSGMLRLQKTLFFLREFVFPIQVQFAFRPYPYGVYSKHVVDEIGRMRKPERYQGRSSLLEVFHSKPKGEFVDNPPWEFKLTPEGTRDFERFSRELKAVKGVGRKGLRGVQELVNELYHEPSSVLGAASKEYFTEHCWKLFRAGQIYDLGRDLVRKDPRLRDEDLPHILNALAEALKESDPGFYEVPLELDEYLLDSIPPTSFIHDDVVTLRPSEIKTNFFFPVLNFSSDGRIINIIAQECKSLVPSDERFDGVIVTEDGLDSHVAKAYLRKIGRDDVTPVGPIIDRSTGKMMEKVDPGLKRGKTYLCFLNTYGTGTTLEKVFQYAEGCGAHISRIIAMASREMKEGDEVISRRGLMRFNVIMPMSRLLSLLRKNADDWRLD